MELEKQKSEVHRKYLVGGVLLEMKDFIFRHFDLTDDQAPQEEIESNIRKNVEFRGTNLWILIFAIVVASVGLNVNSTAVIIGAMLISPLMGPILGVGLALAVCDFELLKRSFRNLLFAVSVSLVVSTLYFMMSPLTIVQSELLARTSPTIWDVLIATFGGLAGIVAQSRKDRSSPVIPGVAIATALMPPICTAGFGVASGEWTYVIGAIYLFSINAVFIALSCFVVSKFVMQFKPIKLRNLLEAKRMNQVMAFVAVVMVVPSLFMAYIIVQETIFEANAATYLRKVFVFEDSEAVSSSFKYDPNGEGNVIEVVMIGEPLSAEVISVARNQLPLFSLEGTKLVVRQANKDDKVDNETFSTLLRTNAEIIEDKNLQIKELEENLARYSRDTLPQYLIAREMGTLWDAIYSVNLSRSDAVTTKGEVIEGGVICILRVYDTKRFSFEDELKAKKWLQARTNIEDIKMVIRAAEVTDNKCENEVLLAE